MLSVYRKLLRLYPAEHRELFGEEMIAVLIQECAENTNRKRTVRARLALREIAGLVNGAVHEHVRVWFESRNGLSLYDGRFTMRNGFRFPKSTAVLMTIILAGVIVAIRKGEVIATTLPPFSQPITPIHPAHSYLLPGVIMGFLFFYAVGLAGWAIVFALRRSGVHRLADMSGQQQ
jgi:hypothetical protein